MNQTSLPAASRQRRTGLLVFGVLLLLCGSATRAAAAETSPPPPPQAWRLQDALGLPSWLTLAVENRVRYESVDNQFRAGGKGGDQDVAIRSLVLLEASYAPFRLGAEMIDGRAVLDDAGTSLDTSQVDTLDLLQAYIGWDQSDVAGSGLVAHVRGGRQTLNFGSSRLVARSVSRNTITTFTGIDATLEAPAKWQLRGFYVLPVSRLPDQRPALDEDEIEFDREDSASYFTGVFLRSNQLPYGANLELYVYYLHEPNTNSEFATRHRRLFTPGLRLYAEPKVGQLDYELEGAAQTGSSRASAARSDVVELDHLAHFSHVQVGYTFALPWSPRLLVQYDYASGDASATDHDNGRFDTLFGERRFEFGPTGLWGAFARSNINSPGYRVLVKPYKTVTAFAGHRLFWLADSHDTWTTSGVKDASGHAGKFIGNQLEANVVWNVIPTSVTLEAGWAYLFKGRFARSAPNAPTNQDDSSFFYAQTVLRF